jgi:integrase
MSLAYQPVPTNSKLQEIQKRITGYWQNDVWYTGDSMFDAFREQSDKYPNRYIDFSKLNENIKQEMKYFILELIFEKQLNLNKTIMENYGKSLSKVSIFMNHYYPDIKSITEIDLPKSLIHLRTFLIENNIKLRTDCMKSKLTRYETTLKRLHQFYCNYYNTRDEYEKDIWDIRNIDHTKIKKHVSHYLLNFSDIPLAYRSFVKRYIKYRLSRLSCGQCRTDISGIKMFLQFIYKRHPDWKNLNNLTRIDIELYIAWFNKYTSNFKASKNGYFISLNTFLRNIEIFEYEEAPSKPLSSLIFKEDFPKFIKSTENSIKFIPENVLKQLEDNLEYLTPSEYIPVIILLRASGWRISDILNLRYDNCLERTSQGWYLCGDIIKTDVLNHRIPITDEVSNVVKAVIDNVSSKSNQKNNPNKLLFAKTSGPRRGYPHGAEKISDSLNRLAQTKQILDDQGNIFHFKNHAFRHTKGIELINNGMNILHVQKWMAHASPEMTLVYAKILDTTMRKSWEEATKQGLFRLDDAGVLKKIDISSIENEDIIEWEYIRHNLDAVRMPLGYCMKPKKQECHSQLNPCLTCRNLCTTPDFIPQFETEIHETKVIIEKGICQNRSVWVEKNQALLERYESILAVLKGGKIHHKAGKKGREYIGEERTNG